MNIFHDKVAIVTGSASGIGQALATELGRRGAQVVLADINGAGAKETADRIQAAGGRAKPAVLDVSDAEAVKKLVDETAAEFGRIDYMFNNAGIAVFGEQKDIELSDWRRVIGVNLWGVINGIQAAYPHMIRQGTGHIVNTASLGGLIPTPAAMSYIATKHAVVGLSTSLRSEAETYGVKVSVICPWFIDTPIFSRTKNLSETDIQSLPNWVKISPERCARIIRRGVERNKAIIIVGWSARLVWYIYRTFPGFFIWSNRFVIARMRKRR